MKYFNVLILFGVLVLTSSWTTDYSESVRESIEKKLPVLLFFSGSDWSAQSMQLKHEVLDSSSFQERVEDKFICVEINFPKHTQLSSPVERDVNEMLRQRFGITSYPTLILLATDGREITRLGYLPEEGEQLAATLLCMERQDAYLKEALKKLPEKREALVELYQLAQELSQIEAQDEIMGAGLERNEPYFLLERYRQLAFVDRISSSEALAFRHELLKSSDHQIHFQVAIIDFEAGGARSVRPLEAYLKKFGDIDSENVWRIEMMIAQFYLDKDEWVSALEHAEVAQHMAPHSLKNDIEHSLSYIRKQVR